MSTQVFRIVLRRYLGLHSESDAVRSLISPEFETISARISLGMLCYVRLLMNKYLMNDMWQRPIGDNFIDLSGYTVQKRKEPYVNRAGWPPRQLLRCISLSASRHFATSAISKGPLELIIDLNPPSLCKGIRNLPVANLVIMRKGWNTTPRSVARI